MSSVGAGVIGAPLKVKDANNSFKIDVKELLSYSVVLKAISKNYTTNYNTSLEIKIKVMFDCRTDFVYRLTDMPGDVDTYKKFYKLINGYPTVFFRE